MFGMAGILRLGMRGKKKFRVISRVEDGCSIFVRWNICDFTLSAFYVIINPSTCLHVESWIRV